MQLILIRHYKTQFNVSRQIMGWGDSPRADDWFDDMDFVGRELEGRITAPDCIYSSALERSLRSAEYFAQRMQVATREVAAELNEINYGSLYQKPKSWVREHYPLHKSDPGFVYPQGESFNQLQQRTSAFVRSLVAARAGQSVLCVVHAGVIRALLSYFLELDYAAQLRRKVSHRYIGVLEFDADRCASYDEWGVASGFVTDAVVTLPHSRKTA